MSGNFSEVTYDKFTFKVEKTYLYHSDECWAYEEGGLVTVGITDFLQTVAGDVAFLEAPDLGTELSRGGKAGLIETIKTTIDLISPLGGIVQEINPILEDEPQLINSEPYGAGWIMKISPSNWDTDKKNLLTAEDYFPIMEEKIKKQLGQG
jgi:glycine cleavage system H protein